MSEKIAAALSELFAPWIINIAFFLVLGVITGAWLPALAAAIGTGAAPMILILVLMRGGKVGNHHVTSREQRGGVIIGIAVCVLVLLAVLALIDAPRLIWVAVWSALIFLGVFGVVTTALKIKASIHVGLWVCVITFLGLTVDSWWFLGLLMAPVIAWSREVISHHTRREVIVGALTGLVVTFVSAELFLG
ncbi:phosphoesterase [Corynebacterium sp. A21]|uniref:phosphoesterase n=1 Tax=Corynebacterium sp. A21 TaxID=3457318 RepID=UPI003FD2E4E8